MNDSVRTRLRELIAAHGPNLTAEPKRLRALLDDACPGMRRETNTLIAALEQRVAADLSATPGPANWALLAPRLALRLATNCAMDEAAARWAVDSWGLALGKVSEAELRRQAAPVPPPPQPSTDDNLRRWVASSHPSQWVEARRGQWDHTAWLDLLAALKASAYWPLDPTAVGRVLEEEKARYLASRPAASPPPTPVYSPPPPPTLSSPPATATPAGGSFKDRVQGCLGCLFWLCFGYVCVTGFFYPSWPLSGARILGWVGFQKYIGDSYRLGLGPFSLGWGPFTVDPVKAIEWYGRAADLGDADAMVRAGEMYEKGSGVGKDLPESAKWYRRAAEHGNRRAQFKIAWMYRNGHGVTRNDGEAIIWYRKAADQGEATAQVNLGLMYESGEGVPVNKDEAVRYYRLAATQNEASGQNALGSAYEYGIGVPASLPEALRLYKLAADQNHRYALENLGRLHEEGKGVTQDSKRAAEYYRRAATEYEKDEGYRPDPAEATKLRKKAEELEKQK